MSGHDPESAAAPPPPAPDTTGDDGSSQDNGATAHEGSVVHARGLTHLYDETHGLRDVDLDVPAGQILGVVGMDLAGRHGRGVAGTGPPAGPVA